MMKQALSTSKRPVRQRGRRAGLLAAAALAALTATAPAARADQASVDATYWATLGGFTVGAGSLSFAVGRGGEYQAAISAEVSGFARLVSNRSATASATGRAEPGRILPHSYSLSINGGAQPNTVSMNFAGGSVTNVEATEFRAPGWDRRVPLLPEHKRNVVDPLGAFVVGMPLARDPLSPSVCNRTLKVFDGRVRYDLHLVYGAKNEIKGEAGSYSGPAIVCSVAYRPIGGYRVLSPEEQKFERNIEFSIWFVPIGNTNVLIPHRVVVGTPSGLLVVDASRFEIKGTKTAEVKPGDGN